MPFPTATEAAGLLGLTEKDLSDLVSIAAHRHVSKGAGHDHCLLNSYTTRLYFVVGFLARPGRQVRQSFSSSSRMLFQSRSVENINIAKMMTTNTGLWQAPGLS
jgi:hypothetical protein